MNNIYLKTHFPDDEEGEAMLKCIQSIPLRFREDGLDVFYNAEDRGMWNMRSIKKAWLYFLDDIMEEMSEEEIINCMDKLGNFVVVRK